MRNNCRRLQILGLNKGSSSFAKSIKNSVMGLRLKDVLPSKQRKQEVNTKSKTAKTLETRTKKKNDSKNKLKWLISAANCLLLILGIVLLILQYSQYHSHDDIYLKHAEKMLLKPLVYLPTTFVVVDGILLVALAIYGFFSVSSEERRPLILHIMFDTLLLFANVGGLTAVVSFSEVRISEIAWAMSHDKNLTDCSVTMQFDHSTVSFSLCHAQRDLGCCGISLGDEDYGTVDCNLPITCCNDAPQKTKCCQSDTSVHKNGCFQLLLERLVYKSRCLAVASMIITSICLFTCLMLTRRLLNRLRTDASTTDTNVLKQTNKDTKTTDQSPKKIIDKIQAEKAAAAINLQQVADMRKS